MNNRALPKWAKGYGVYLFVLLLLAAVWAWLQFGRDMGFSLKPDHFQIKDPQLVDRIFIAERNGLQVELHRTGETWTVNQKYPADPDAIKGLFETLTQVEIKHPVSEELRQKVLAQMSTASLKLEIYTKGKKKTYYVGPPTQDMAGTYWLQEGSEQPQVAFIPGFNGFLTVRFSTRELDWRDRTLLAIPAPEIEWVRIKYPEHPEQSFNLEVIDDQYIRLSNMTGDTAAGEVNAQFLRTYLDAFTRIKLESIETNIPAAKTDSIRASKPLAQLWIKSRNQKQAQEITFYNLSTHVRGPYFTPEGMPAGPDPDRCLVYAPGLDYGLAQFRVIGPLLVTYGQFIANGNNVF